MTTKTTAKKFRIRRNDPQEDQQMPAKASRNVPASDAAPQAAPTTQAATPKPAPEASAQQPAQTPAQTPEATASVAPAQTEEPITSAERLDENIASGDIDAIRREGLTGRQLRMARRVAQKQGIAVTSDFDAVLKLRQANIDPFERSTVLELVTPNPNTGERNAPSTSVGTQLATTDRVHLPQTTAHGPKNLPSTETIDPADRRAKEIRNIQRDLASRRRRKSVMLMTRLLFFVLMPTAMVGYYFYNIATPMFATQSEFVIQQAEPASAAGGLGGMFQGTSMATQQDSITVQSYLSSRAAMVRLDNEYGFKSHFSQDSIDAIQRLPQDATNEAAFGIYSDMVRVSYDPTEGILRLEVIAASPEASQTFSEALIGYAEEQVDQLTQRLRGDQMAGALESYETAETKRAEALAGWLQIQQDVQQIDPIGETSARTSQISALESERQRLTLTLQDRLNVSRPNQAQVASLESQIANIENLIGDLRQQMTASADGSSSLASRNTELRLAEENYTFQTVLAQQALTQMETARIEANRQVRYLSMGVEPVAPDEATFPRAFENTILAFLIFAGIYLMISITASILREQVTN